MIELYSPSNTDFVQNGNVVLTPIRAELSCKLNEAWVLELEHPVDSDGRYKEIVEGAVIKAPTFMPEKQLFRVESVKKQDTGIVATAVPIFMDCRNTVFLEDVRPTAKTGQQALNIIFNNTQFTGESNITKASTAYYIYKNALEAIASDDDNSFLNRWGGEILFDNFKIIVNTQVGGDYGVSLRYGKNIPVDGLTENIDIGDVATRVYPKGYNGVVYDLSTGVSYIDSPLINSYPTVNCRTKTYEHIKMAKDVEGDPEEGDIICNTQAQLNTALRNAVTADFTKGIDKPEINIQADMILLQNTTLYEDYQQLETVGLGDTVHCRHAKLDIETDARVISLTYDCIRKKAVSVELGRFRYNYFKNVSSAMNRVDSAIRPDGSVIAEQIQGFINGANAALKAQYTAASPSNVQAILFENTDPSSPLYGALGIGTQGLQISKTRTADGRSWDWTTAITANGIIADTIVAGLLADKTGMNYLNLDTGAMKMGNWKVNLDSALQGRRGSLYSDNGNYRAWLSTPGVSSSGTPLWVFSVQKKDSSGDYVGLFLVDSSGEVRCNFENGAMVQIRDGSGGDPDLVKCIAADGSSAAMQGGRFVCADSRGIIKFDSNNFTS